MKIKTCTPFIYQTMIWRACRIVAGKNKMKAIHTVSLI